MPGEKSSAGGPVEAICPKCCKRHRLRISLEAGDKRENRIACAWTGKGTPRIFCYDCKKRLGIVNSAMFPRLEYDTIEGRI